jgi:hypothetical protein
MPATAAAAHQASVGIPGPRATLSRCVMPVDGNTILLSTLQGYDKVFRIPVSVGVFDGSVVELDKSNVQPEQGFDMSVICPAPVQPLVLA